jgi:hypothetical protein
MRRNTGRLLTYSIHALNEDAMKRFSFLPALVTALTLLLSVVACNPDDNSATPDNPIAQQVQSGDWIITSFIDSGKDETNHFTGYTFVFGSSGALTATKGSQAYTGTWSVTNDDSNDDNPSGDVDFNIFFNLTNDFEDLNEDWHIISQSDDKIELIHVSGGNGGTDYLTFERA